MNTTKASQQLIGFEKAVNEGLSASPKTLPCRYIYDDKGSQLFEAIMKLPEYYLTRAEKSLFEEKGSEITHFVESEDFDLVELGAGNGEKTKLLIDALKQSGKKMTYCPVDISAAAVETITQKMHNCFPNLKVNGKVSDYFEALKDLKSKSSKQKLVLFIGSNIGNFTPEGRAHFLTDLQQSLQKGDLVYVGFDLKKDIAALNAAYNDAQKVTAAFNLNLLKRINKELGGSFDESQFQFYASYDPIEGAVKSFLVSKKEQQVDIESLEKSFHFDAWEPIHTESSYKFNFNDIRLLAQKHHFNCKTILTNQEQTFSGAIWEAL